MAARASATRVPDTAAAGRCARFERLCAASRDSMLRYVRWLTGDFHAAEDIVQVVLFRAWKSLHTLADDAAVHDWLNTIARREVARAYSRKRLVTEDVEALSASDQLYASHAEGMELEDLHFLVGSMRDRDRSILLQTLYGYSAGEIAASERCPVGQVRTRLFRARDRLRLLLG